MESFMLQNLSDLIMLTAFLFVREPKSDVMGQHAGCTVEHQSPGHHRTYCNILFFPLTLDCDHQTYFFQTYYTWLIKYFIYFRRKKLPGPMYGIFSLRLENNQSVFWQTWDRASCCFWSAVTLPCLLFLSTFSIAESWTLTLTEACKACSSLDGVPWVSYHCALGVIFCRPVTSGNHLSRFSLTVTQRNGFVPLSRLFHAICSRLSLDCSMICCC